MSKKMLIDAAHAEEVRVCVLENRKVEDFDFESSARKPLRGNIYLARITRVEPSLQAAFVEYGGNRHGFLAFNEIHPDYYQIPVSDRQLLQEAEAEEAALAAELDLAQRGDDEDDEDGETTDSRDEDDSDLGDELDAAADEDSDDTLQEENAEGLEAAAAEDDAQEVDEDDQADIEASETEEEASEDIAALEQDNSDSDDKALPPIPFASAAFPFAAAPVSESDTEEEIVEAETAGEAEAEADAESNEDSDEENNNAKPVDEKKAKRRELLEQYKEARRKRARLIRNYKIQEVIKRRQILLVQVVKEERGNKGAALTTYMSLAGRYCVLMPNTARGGGISRKIPSVSDRKRLRRVVDSLDVSQGMGLIIRTAGAKRTKIEIKRDYDYLTRLWENIRALTLESIAPCLIYEEASLIKRAIRDLYDKDISKVMVEGEDGYREAKDFMKMLMPSHAKNVQPYKEKLPLFVRHDVEKQLDAMYQPTVRLKSGGYLVINQTEALIAVDVNSGKATRERNIELTALKTNLEAAVETARQCRLRDLAGLIVIDFIDMEENKNNRAVEKKLKEALKHDRARIQVGRISTFGLLEMSRQRRRSGIIDGTTHACPTCNGAGAVRSNEMAALRILRAVESEAIAGRTAVIAVKASMEVTLYVLNHKREWLKRIEDDYALTVEINADETKAGDQYEIEKRGAARPQKEEPSVIRADMVDAVSETEEKEDVSASNDEAEADEDKPTRKRRRRRRKKRSDGENAEAQAAEAEGASDEDDSGKKDEEEENSSASSDDENGERKKRRRRGRRGGRRKNRRNEEEASENVSADSQADQPKVDSETGSTEEHKVSDDPQPEYQAEADNAPASEQTNGAAEEITTASENGAVDQTPDETPASTPAASTPEEIAERVKKRKSTKKGWWSRAIGG